MTPSPGIRDALAELVACKDSKPMARKDEYGRAWMERNAAHIVRFSDAWEAARRALASPPTAPEGSPDSEIKCPRCAAVFYLSESKSTAVQRPVGLVTLTDEQRRGLRVTKDVEIK